MSGAQFDLSDCVAIVTGATEGMGEAVAELFAASGARLVLSARTAEKLESKAAAINANAGKAVAVFVAGDLGDKAHLRGLVATAIAQFGKLTTVLCVPTIKPWLGSSIDTPDAVLDEQLLYILKSRFWLSSIAIPHMIDAGGGSLVYIGSGSVFEATSERSANSIARAGELQMMKNFAAEFGPQNIRANIIAPAMVDSSGSKGLFNSAVGRERIGKLPLRRGGTTQEVARAAAFLASDASSFTTGAVLPVDGGRLLHSAGAMLTAAMGEAGSTPK